MKTRIADAAATGLGRERNLDGRRPLAYFCGPRAASIVIELETPRPIQAEPLSASQLGPRVRRIRHHRSFRRPRSKPTNAMNASAAAADCSGCRCTSRLSWPNEDAGSDDVGF